MSWRAPRLGWMLVALLAVTLISPARAADTVVYYHTDALRSVAVVTNAQGQVLERTHYAPYGQVLDRPLRDGPGYGGHEEDAATGLVYMQQRYYCSECGRFLSADPVQVDPNTGANFNRYWYANDNPYRYTDPDGRETGIAFHSEFVMMGGQAQTYQAPGDWVGPALKVAFSMLPFVGAGMNAVEAAHNPTAGNMVAVALGAIPAGGVLREVAPIAKEATQAAKSAIGIGEHAGESIAARSAARDFTAAERTKINEIGSTTGCHTCGVKDPGTKSGNFVPDHQPASALNTQGGAQRLYPHCLQCSRQQGLEIARKIQKEKQ